MRERYHLYTWDDGSHWAALIFPPLPQNKIPHRVVQWPHFPRFSSVYLALFLALSLLFCLSCSGSLMLDSLALSLSRYLSQSRPLSLLLCLLLCLSYSVSLSLSLSVCSVSLVQSLALTRPLLFCLSCPLRCPRFYRNGYSPFLNVNFLFSQCFNIPANNLHS